MRVVIAGGHGKIALLLERHLAGRGDTAVGLIRNPGQAAALRAAGATRAGVHRYLLVSSMGVDDPPAVGTDDVWAAYLRAKRAAEDDLRARDLAWTVLRPGRLTDDDPAGRVTLTRHAGRGAISRADVAHVLAALLDEPRTAGATLELVDGPTPIADAVRSAATP
ncbi:NAD(P)-binding oxidoreductase [Micromonospora sp. WMMD710]|uniref:NAD(P)-binding oxidoreductase n=1 Tax=Micromonospora sp. WMMD710 TaxID=3016085 RepID=UPI002417891B|nr:NAD(P)-binding oxidoreductase [Micromonospora sp. WMMD710]MDG4757990.1 SDR family oxidoreductase [Micromonospora sp. WMMD710]